MDRIAKRRKERKNPFDFVGCSSRMTNSSQADATFQHIIRYSYQSEGREFDSHTGALGKKNIF